MKSIALIHTVKTVANSFEQKLKDYVGEPVKIHNLWDDFLANNPNEIGEFTIENRCRLYNDIKSAEMTGADMIVVTCSTLTPVVTCGERILVLATAGSTEGPMREKLNAEAAKLGKSIQIDFQANAEAFQAMKAVQMERHDAILLDMAKNISGYDCVVLAQASMAHLDQKIETICKIPVLSSPGLCMEQVKETLKTI